jgi:hypothetical protein
VASPRSPHPHLSSRWRVVPARPVARCSSTCAVPAVTRFSSHSRRTCFIRRRDRADRWEANGVVQEVVPDPSRDPLRFAPYRLEAADLRRQLHRPVVCDGRTARPALFLVVSDQRHHAGLDVVRRARCTACATCRLPYRDARWQGDRDELRRAVSFDLQTIDDDAGDSIGANTARPMGWATYSPNGDRVPSRTTACSRSTMR